jgi:predicted extracellular nuclease
VIEGNGGTTPISFTVTRAGDVSAAGTVGYTVDLGTDGFSASAADFASPLIGTVSFGIGEASKLITIDVNGDLLPEADEGFTISLYNPSSGSLGDATATGTIVNDDGPPPLVTISDVSQAEGDGGTTLFTFTVSRTGGTTGFSIDYHTIAGTAGDPSDFVGVAGTLVFADNENSKTIDVTVKGDTAGEHAETFTVKLDNPLGAVIADSVGTGTILNDDVVPIHELQGAGHVSPFLGESVKTRGIVTARDNNGFWIQTPDADVDGDLRTSEGIFVFTGSAPPATAAIGNLVTITATLSEFAPAGDLSVTELTGAVITVDSTGNALPSAVLIGAGGRVVPNAVYDDDGFTSFDIATDGLDFYESLEGMRVTVETPRAVSNSNSFGETYVVASNGAGATGINARGGITISGGDMNPERILLDADPDLFAGYAPNHSIGDLLGNVTGILSYAFSSYRVIATEAVAATSDVTLGLETTSLSGGPGTLTIASYNVENLDPTDPASKFQEHALDIVLGMGSPDIIGLQEVQDADGAGGGSNLSGAATAQALINAIVAAGGPTYLYVEVAPSTPGTTGGEPGGNIRPGYLYNPARVSYVPGSAFAIDGAPYSNSRKPLVADFVFLGETVTVVDMHLTSRLGSDGLFGANQPPINAGDASRLAQAQGVRDYLDTRFGPGGGDNVVVLGDMNSFYFEAPSNAIEAGGAYTNLYETLASEERYSAIFEGNLQGLDNIIVSANLYGSARFDPVHRTSEQPDSANRPSDHDPVVAALVIDAVPVAVGEAYLVDEDGLLAVGGAGVLANDSDLDGSGLPGNQVGLSAILVDGPDHAAAFTLNADGTFSYVPAANYNGTDSFTYKPNDGRLDGNIVTVTVTVLPVNDAPVGIAEAYNVVEDSSLSVPGAGLLGNDVEVDGPALAAMLVAGPAHAAAFTLNPDGSFSYTPAADYAGPDSFTYRPSDGILLGDPVTVALNVIAEEDAAIARNDGFSTLESAILGGNVFADNGGGADSDPDSPLAVAAVNGSAVAVGQQVALPSGALLTLNADGTFSYDPNGRFNTLTTAATGASNLAAQDLFTYSLAGGGTATVLVDIGGERTADDWLVGAAGNDVVTGNGFNDSFFMQQGGNDRAIGNGGNDGFYFGAALTNADIVDGGLGNDSLALQGNYPFVLLGDVNVEVVAILPGNDTRFGDLAGNFYDYNLATRDANVNPGTILTIVAGNLRAGEDLVFNGSAESDGSFRIFAGRGVDTLTGGLGNDGFLFGADLNLTGADRVNGSGGIDSIALRGNYVGAGAVVFQNASLTGIEVIALLSGLSNQFGGQIVIDGFDYDLTLANGNVAAGQLLDIVATGLRQGELLRFDGRAELDGALRIFSGAGDDTLYGSAGADFLSGGLGADRLEGGPGNDTYLYRSTTESSGFSRDTIAGFAAGDRIDLSVIDANPATGASDAFAFIGTGAFTGVAGQLRYAMQGADALVQGDVNGDGVADLVILIENWTPLSADFVL